MGKSGRVDPSRKRAIRLTVALTAALLLASALVYTSFSAGRRRADGRPAAEGRPPGRSYILAGTVLTGSVRHEGTALLFRVRDPKLGSRCRFATRGSSRTRSRPDGRVLVTVQEQGAGQTFVGEQNSLTTKCPSKYQAAAARTDDGLEEQR